MNEPESERIYQLLVIDDSQADVRLLKEVLRSWRIRHCLYVADDGSEALDLLHNRGNYNGAPRPDLIFLDINMPKMDGFQVLESIRNDRNPDLRAIPIIVFTSSSNPSEVVKAYDRGANGFITKPADFDEFCKVMAATESFWFDVATILPSSVPPVCEANQPRT
jgi:CheY-like chemotaxis protein